MSRDLMEAAEWAKDFMASNDLILDTETTALHDAEICQIAMIDRHGNTHIDMLIKPTRPIPANATAIHGITNEMVAKSPSFAQAWPVIEHLLMNYGTVVYNAEYDTGVISNCLRIARITSTWLPIASCAMLNYSAYIGEAGRYGGFKWQKLPPCGDDAHNALADCRSTLEVIKTMAGG